MIRQQWLGFTLRAPELLSAVLDQAEALSSNMPLPEAALELCGWLARHGVIANPVAGRPRHGPRMYAGRRPPDDSGGTP